MRDELLVPSRFDRPGADNQCGETRGKDCPVKKKDPEPGVPLRSEIEPSGVLPNQPNDDGED